METLERREALRKIALLLEERGDTEALRALLGLAEAAETAAAQAKTTSEITSALLADEATFRLVHSHELDAMSVFDPKTREILDVNAAWVSLYGWTRDEACRMKVTDVSHEPERTIGSIAEARKATASRLDLRWHRAKDGRVFPVELTCGPLRLGDRDAMYATMRDVSARVEAERALARSEESYRTLIETMPDGVVVHRNGAVVYMSPAARRMLGYGAEDDITGLGPLDLVHPDDRAASAVRIERIVGEGAVVPVAEKRLLRKDGRPFVAEVTGYLTLFDGEPAILSIARDVSARKQIETQLVLADRLASLGRLAATIGHELNNPLAYVLGVVRLAEKDLARATDLPEAFASRMASHLTVMAEGGRRMRDIVDGLKTLGRGDERVQVAIDVARVLDVCCNMADHELRHRGKLVRAFEPGLYVSGTEGRLGQVFLNLLVNAAQSLAEQDAATNEVRVTAWDEADQVVVEVRDTGVGIPAEDLERIFEPFFTTKDGAGMGLGLSISHQIVTDARGSLTAHPREGGRGTVFRVVLPAARAPTPSPPP